VAALDLAAARTLEPHLDAAAILGQAGMAWEPGFAWGVFAAEARGSALAAVPAGGGAGWLLEGEKPWCSLAGQLDRALVTATVPGGRRAFAVDLRQPGVVPVPGTWLGHGLPRIPSGPVRFDAVAASPVGDTDWYLHREGFAWGGMAVAACWFGGAVGLFRTLHRAAMTRQPDQLALAWLGEADRLLAAGAALLHTAAGNVDAKARAVDAAVAGPTVPGWREAHRVRGNIAGICERMLAICGHALGPGPLAFDAGHAQRVADLELYIRQHHASRDDAALGGILLPPAGQDGQDGTGPW
jgi:alkylation response protein AidB-like acyl-CoA dehydrogenase